MEKRKQRRAAGAGWKVGSTADFLGLSEAESAMVELRLRLGDALRSRRMTRGLSQAALAKRLGSSQSRVAKMEAADATVSLDLLLRGLLVLGASPRDVAKALERRDARVAV